MTRALFYVDALPEVGELAVVDGDEGFHAANVRRIRSGEELDLGDGDGHGGALCRRRRRQGPVDGAGARPPDRAVARRPTVTVVQALPKSDRSELAIELATEAGADAFVGLAGLALRGALGSAAKVDKGLRRWRAVARSAARQSRRPYIPSVTGVVSTAELVQPACETAVRRRWCCTSRPPPS